MEEAAAIDAAQTSRATAPTGRQLRIEYSGPHRTGAVRAVITELGATLRSLEMDGVQLLEGFAEDAAPPLCAGQILIPWPNRVRDGVWNDNGTPRRLEMTEPERGNAIHGLVRTIRHDVVSESTSEVTLRARIDPSEGYPFALEVETNYAAGPAGLTVTHTIVNVGERTAVAAIGAHPYFRIGEVPTEQLTVTVLAASRVLVDERLNPIGVAAVEGTRFDLSRGAVVGGLDLDTAYTDLMPGSDGLYRHTLEAPDGRRIELWADESFRHGQVFTTDGFPGVRGPRWAITIEPTTAAPDALNTGEDLRSIEPGHSWTAAWGIGFVHPLRRFED